MVEKAGFSLKHRNPDVLTSIANLSNDEVFTPPSFANQMLDTIEDAWAKNNNGAIIWEDKNVTFLDPFTKSGVFLREITSRLSKGLKSHIPDDQERVNHILAKQVFGVAITELTALLARRSVYCSKHANGRHSICTEFDTPQGNIWFERTEHTWVGGKERIITVDGDGNESEVTLDGRCRFCGAKQKEYERGLESESHAYSVIHTDDPESWAKKTFGESMQFDVIVGNPPYQLSSSGTSDEPIYHLFVQQAKELQPRFISMVTPSRWFTGGKGLDAYRAEMIQDRRIRTLCDFPDSKDTFPGVEIKGGTSFFLWDRDNQGDCRFKTYSKGQLISETTRDLRKGKGVVVRDNNASSIIEKVMAADLPRLVDRVSPQTPFGIYTNFSEWETTPGPNWIRLYKRGLDDAWIDPKHVTARNDWIPKIKVLVSYAYNGGDALPHQVIGRPVVAEANSACTQTYFVAGAFDDLSEARHYASYLRTRFVRFLIRQRKISQHTRPDTFAFVPDLPTDQVWTDEILADRFGLTDEEVSYITTQVRDMDEESAIEDEAPEGI